MGAKPKLGAGRVSVTLVGLGLLHSQLGRSLGRADPTALEPCAAPEPAVMLTATWDWASSVLPASPSAWL